MRKAEELKSHFREAPVKREQGDDREKQQIHGGETGDLFYIVGIQNQLDDFSCRQKKRKNIPWVSISIFFVLVLGCLFCDLFLTKDPTYLDLLHCTEAPGEKFLFGTDTLGRDIFSCIWYGGRISILIGLLATAISAVIAIVYGSLSGMASAWVDTILMGLTDIFLSVPALLLITFLQAIFGKASMWSIAFAIGITSWFSMVKVVRTEVRQLRNSEYILSARCMGAGFFHILFRHLAPDFLSSMMFMVVMNVRTAIVAESTLSFLGLGLPVEVISWGSMLSLAQDALLMRAWWMILIPGGFLVALIMSLTNIGHWLRRQNSRKERYL